MTDRGPTASQTPAEPLGLVPAHKALLAALLLVLAWELIGLDLPLSRLYGSASGFAWREAWLTRSLLHEGGRLLAGLALFAQVLCILRPPSGGPSRAAHGYWFGVIVFSLLLIPFFKRISTSSCPWDLAEFGGVARYVPHWLLGVGDGGPGHCFPSGHITSAAGFVGLYFLWRGHRPALARGLLGAAFVLAALYAWAQLARGAHHLSHSLWSVWICAAVAVFAARWAPGRGR
jgi:membrane-associated PAP2 superfamily phosphatase